MLFRSGCSRWNCWIIGSTICCSSVGGTCSRIGRAAAELSQMSFITCSIRLNALVTSGSKAAPAGVSASRAPDRSKQFVPQQFFEADHMPTDRALRHVQRLCTGRKAEVLAHRIERAQGIEREPATVDGAVVVDEEFQIFKGAIRGSETARGQSYIAGSVFDMQSCPNAIWMALRLVPASGEAPGRGWLWIWAN